jgi:hypothetical protein
MRRQLAEIEALIVAGVRHDKIRGLEASARRHRAIEQPRNVRFVRRIRCDRLRAAARGHDGLGDLADLGRGPPGDENVIAALRKTPAQRGAAADLTATNRMVGRRTASQIASASAASFLLRLT